MLTRTKLGIVAILAAGACRAEEAVRTPGPAPLPPPGQSLAVEATVRHVPLEGGCWVLETSSGTYEPMGLPQSLRRDGQKVLAWVRQAGDIASICMVGTIVQVDSAVAR